MIENSGRILIYKEIDREEWRRLVASSKTGTWFQGPEAYAFLASMPELFRPFVLGVASLQLPPKGKRAEHHPSLQERTEDRLILRGVCVGYVTVEKSAVKQYFTRRAIILGGPVIANDASSEEVKLLMMAVRNQMMNERSQASSMLRKRSLLNDGPIYIETRNFNDYSKWKDAFERAGFEYKKHLNFHVDCRDKEAMWERLSENRCRQVRKSDATTMMIDKMSAVEPLNDEAQIREWYEILRELYRTKVKTPLWPVEFFLEAYRQGVGKFLLVKYENKVIGGSMVVNDGMMECWNDRPGAVYEWFECGRNAEYKEQYPSVMATWAGIQWAQETGCARYDMMGAGEPGVPYGVRDFKSEFGGEMVEHGRFMCVCHPVLYKIGAIVVKIMKKFA